MVLAIAFVFVGNHAFTADQLHHAMVHDSGEAELDDDQLARATLWLSAYYWDRGYANVHISDPVITDTAVTIHIDEGPKFTIASVAITGHPLGDPRGDLAFVKTRARSVFSRREIAADMARLSDDYGDRGYAFANIIPLTHVDLDRKTIALDFEVEPGEPAVIDEIEVRATSRDDEARIRRAIPIVVGGAFSHAELMDSKERAAKVARSEVDIAMMHGTTNNGVKILIEVRD